MRNELKQWRRKKKTYITVNFLWHCLVNYAKSSISPISAFALSLSFCRERTSRVKNLKEFSSHTSLQVMSFRQFHIFHLPFLSLSFSFFMELKYKKKLKANTFKAERERNMSSEWDTEKNCAKIKFFFSAIEIHHAEHAFEKKITVRRRERENVILNRAMLNRIYTRIN